MWLTATVSASTGLEVCSLWVIACSSLRFDHKHPRDFGFKNYGSIRGTKITGVLITVSITHQLWPSIPDIGKQPHIFLLLANTLLPTE